MNWDDETPKPKPAIVLGEDLERYAIAELNERITALQSEIERSRKEIAAKKKHADAAAALFKD